MVEISPPSRFSFDQRLQKILDGKAYSAGISSGVTSPNFLAARIHNLKGSVKTVTVTGLWISSSLSGLFDIQGPITPDAGKFTGIPTTLLAKGRNSGQVPALAVVDTDAQSITTIAQGAFRCFLLANAVVFVPQAAVLPPDSSMEWEWETIAGAPTHAFTVEWFEE